MRKTIILLCMTLSFATLCAAQDDKAKGDKAARPDMSGAWKLDKSKSQMGRLGQGQMANAVITLTISHKDPELKITRKLSLNGQQQVQELGYFTDGRGETNPAAVGNTNIKTKTKWDGSK